MYTHINDRLKHITYKIENNFFFTVIRHGLTMMIPILLIGGISCALMNLPYVDYSASSFYGIPEKLHSVFAAIYQGTFGIVSLAFVIVLSLSYGMEKNETIDKIAMYIIVALGAYGAQLDINSPNFNIDSLGPIGTFSALFVTMLSCFGYEKLKKIRNGNGNDMCKCNPYLTSHAVCCWNCSNH